MIYLLTLVIPEQAGIQKAGTIANGTERPKFLGPGLRRIDGMGIESVSDIRLNLNHGETPRVCADNPVVPSLAQVQMVVSRSYFVYRTIRI